MLLSFASISSLPLFAQQVTRTPRIGYLYPAGAQRGTTCQVTLGGQFLEGAKEVLVSGSGLKITILKIDKPLAPKRLNELRDYVAESRKKFLATNPPQPARQKYDLPESVARVLKEAGATEEEIDLFMVERKQRNDYKRQPNLQLAETGVLKVELSPDAALGPREVRIITPVGVSNPISFCIGRLPEQRKEGPLGKTLETAMQVTLPAVINGQILPGTVDHFAFKTRRGAHLVVAVQARDLIPFLADAVPGWFQPVAVLTDAKGKEVAFSKDYRFSPDPVFCYEVAENGSYLLEIRDALYRGREDFVYRITVGEVPFITGIYPLGGRVGRATSISVDGWNLEPPVRLGSPVRLGQRKPIVISPETAEGIHLVSELSNGRVIAEAAFSSDVLPEVNEQQSDPRESKKGQASDEAKPAQKVKLPVIINGRIEAPGEVDVYSFRCTEGAKIVAEVQARRLNSPLDSWLKVTDSEGKQIAFNDDWKDLVGGYLTHKADSYLTFTAPETGTYHVSLGDSQQKGGPEFAYRLRISPPQPDFALRFVPSGVNGRPGLSVPVTLYALRKDGFAGDISCALKDAPAGFALDGAVIQSGTNKVRATLTFPPDFLAKPVNLSVQGTGTLCESGSDCEVTRMAVPAEDMLQAFMYHHLVPTNSLLAATSGSNRRLPPMRSLEKAPINLPAGGVGRAAFVAASGPPKQITDIHLEITEPIDGITVDSVSKTKDGIAVSFRTDAALIKPGLAGNFVLELFNVVTPPPKDGKPQEKRRNSAGYLPAIPFKVVEPAAQGGQ